MMKTIAEIEGLVKDNRIDAAIAGLSDVLSAQPENAEAKMLLGVCRQMKGETEAFCRVYRELAPELSARESSGDDSPVVSRWRSYCRVASYLVMLGAIVFNGGCLLTVEEASSTAAAGAVQELPHESGTVPPAGDAPARSASDEIEAYLKSNANWTRGYDKAADRIVDTDFIEFSIKNPKVSPDFVELRKAKMHELLLKARAKVVKTVMDKTSDASAMPFYGVTVLQQAESISRKNGSYTYQIAILYSWSGEMARAFGEILNGRPVKFTPGGKSAKRWLYDEAKKGALAQWIGPRQYVDDKGNMWFLGISCGAVCDDADDTELNREAAELEAGSEVLFSLYSVVASSKTLNKFMRTKVGANGEKEDQVLKDLGATLGKSSFKDIQIPGCAELWSGTVRHEPSGLDLHVVVYGVNSGSVRTLNGIRTGAVSLGIGVDPEATPRTPEATPRTPEASPMRLKAIPIRPEARPMTKYNMGGQPRNIKPGLITDDDD